MKEGFTTGSCAAAAALASCLWQRDGECPAKVEIIVPEGRRYTPDIIARDPYTCAVIKDAGDDPDVTHGCEVRAAVKLGDWEGGIVFAAGEGVGTVTQPGLKLPVGQAAINPVPRAMIEQAVRSVFPARAATVTVSVAGGETLAEKTFNPRLGIMGGVSILGTDGVVRPMSEQALTVTIALEMSMRFKQGNTAMGLAFGKQGEAMLQKLYPALTTLQMSNFVGFALDEASRLGVARVLIGGHPGKLAKLSAGVMQTHSRYADARREAIITQLALMGAERSLLEKVQSSITTDAAMNAIHAAGYDAVWDRMADAAMRYCQLRVRDSIAVDILFLNREGMPLGQSERLRKDEKRWR